MVLEHILTPGRIGSLELPNRLVFAPVAPRAALPDGTLSPEQEYYLLERAKGGVGLINIGHTFCWPEEKTGGNTGLWADSHKKAFAALCSKVHSLGSKLCIQLGGRGTRRADGNSMAPSSIAVGYEKGKPRAITVEEIEYFVENYGNAAMYARECGFDCAEIHAAHGKLVSLFLSPYSNRREDAYGGSLEKRTLFLRQIMADIQKKAGADFPIIVRYSADDMLEGGTTLAEGVEQAKIFEKAGAAAVHVSGGNQEKGWNTSFSYFFPSCCLLDYAAAVKKAVHIPVIAVGKIGDVFQGDRILAEGKADFIALGRPLVTDAYHLTKARAGQARSIRRCINCLNCFTFGSRKERIPLGITCTVNPDLFREAGFAPVPAATPRKVLVIGGGLAGMQAAATAAQRGHKVELHEAAPELGGQWLVAEHAAYKSDFRSLVPWLLHAMQDAGVEIKLNSRLSLADVQAINPDVVIVATGARPRDLSGVDGLDSTQVKLVQAMDVIMDKAADVGKRVVVLGGRYIGMEVAAKLAAQGRHVSLVEAFELGHGTESRLKGVYRNKLVENNVFIFDNSPLIRLTKNGADIAHRGSLLSLPCETLVLAIGTVPINEFQSLDTSKYEVHTIGDALKIGDALWSIRDGAEVGRQV